MHLAERVGQLTNEGAFEVLAAARQLEAAGRHIVHLELGQPDFPTPPHIVEAGVKALRDGYVKYAPPAGLPRLRGAIADHLRCRGVTTTAENVVVAPGGKSAISTTLLAVVETGADVLLPSVGFSAYEAITRFVGGNPRFYELDARSGFVVTADALAAACTPRTRVLVLNSPHNPTGGALGRGELETIAEFALEHDLIVVSDEIYAGLQYDGAFSSIHALPGMSERTVIVDGFSKSYAMTGWRLGYAVLPPDLVEPVVKLATNSFSCTATFIQHAGVAALTDSQDCVAEMRDEYSARAELVTRSLNAIPGIACAAPKGAFYAFPNVDGLLDAKGYSAGAFAYDLLHDSGVACLAGTAFGAAGEGHLRISFASSRETIALGIERIQRLADAFISVAA